MTSSLARPQHQVNASGTSQRVVQTFPKALGQFAYGVDHPTDRILDNISLDNLVDRVLDRSVNGTWEILAQEWTNDTPSNSNCNGYTSAKLAVTQSGGRRSYKVTQRPWP